jgi:prophage regulatory protein
MRIGLPGIPTSRGPECSGPSTPAYDLEKASSAFDPVIEAVITRTLDTFVASAIRMLDEKRMERIVSRKHQMPSVEPDLIDMHAVILKTGLSRSSIYRAIENAAFPSPVPMSSSRTGYGRRLFIRREVEVWVEEQIAKRNVAL